MHHKVCRVTRDRHTKSTRANSSSSDDAYVFVCNGDKSAKLPHVHIQLNGVRVSVLIDSGAAVNIVSGAIHRTMKPLPQLRPAKIKIFSYGSTDPLPITGVFTCTAEAGNTQCTVYVMKGDGCSLLSYLTNNQLSLIKMINSVSTNQSDSGR